jgi:hypothetical protein
MNPEPSRIGGAEPATQPPTTPPERPAAPRDSPLSYMDPEEYRQQRVPHILRTSESFRWFTRNHFNELVDAGALVKPSRRFMVQPDRFDDAIVSIGQRMARRQSG